jgi:hypothetical protein
MTPVSPSPTPPAPPSVDRVGVMRRSVRCFAFGVTGMVPFIGVLTAWRALRLWQEVSEETGEPAGSSVAKKCAVSSFALAVALFFFKRAGGDPRSYLAGMIAIIVGLLLLVLGILLPARQGYLLIRQYGRTEPREWNPARHFAYWGAGLAYAGLALSSTLISLAFWQSLH